MSNDSIQLPDDVLSFFRPVNRALFGWVWGELSGRIPQIGCRRTKRYVGLYITAWGRSIFAYVDSQTSGLKIGVAKVVVDLIQPIPFNIGPFPNWSNLEHVELFLTERMQEIIDILEAAYQEKAFGLPSVESLARVNSDANELLPSAKGDISSSDEEAKIEGKRKNRFSSYYERIPENRARAIAIHGTTCMVSSCRFNFEAVYGSQGLKFIEVHHLKPLSGNKDGEPQRPNLTTDMAVVCSNCHRMIHRYRNRVLSLEQVSTLSKINVADH